jgi:hypothetical protein
MHEQVTLSFTQEAGTAAGGDDYRFVPCFKVRASTGDQVTTVWTSLSRTAAGMAQARLPEGVDPDQALREALLRFSLRRLQRELADPVARDALLSTLTNTWKLTSDDVDQLLAVAVGDKTCAYQQADGPDLLCLAAFGSDPAVVGVAGLRRIAPTSRPMCAACDMPDAALACSQLSHPEVVGMMTAAGQVARRFVGAMCNLGRDEVQQPGGCRPAGHPCWQRIVQLDSEAPPAAASPLALAEALDGLHAWWRVVVGAPLLELKGAAAVTGLALGCATRAEFVQRMSDLAVVLDSLRVGDAVLPVPSPRWQPPPPNETLNRVRLCLQARLDPDAFERAERAVRRLGRLQRIRSLLQHRGGHDELVRCLAALGVAWPPADWAAAWERVRAEAADALAGLRDELRALAETTG